MQPSYNIAKSWYHSLLRVMVLIFATALVFESGVISPVTKNIAHLSGQQLASVVGMSASIAPNEINVITARLTEKEQELALRENALSEREIALSLGGASSQNGDKVTFLLATVLFILLLLIILNYILDYLRSKERDYISKTT